MSLIKVDLPSPLELRGGWAAMAAVCGARGWSEDVFAASDRWLYHDGGGNWASLRLIEENKVVLIGYDHEYSETYFREAAEYFQEEETDLLAEAPDWWSDDLNRPPVGDWVGFIYGWDGEKWQRAKYEKEDGFNSVGLLKACSINDTEHLKHFAAEAPGLNGISPGSEALRKLISADANVTHSLLEAVVPGWNIEAGVTAANKFLEMRL